MTNGLKETETENWLIKQSLPIVRMEGDWAGSWDNDGGKVDILVGSVCGELLYAWKLIINGTVNHGASSLKN